MALMAAEPKINNFQDDLDFSNKAGTEVFWQEVYKVAFPDMLLCIANPEKSQSQFLGVDRVIHMKSGKTIYIDEKKRREDSADILLEYKSNSNKKENDGWMNKQLLIDYLAYAFMPSKTVHIFNWLALRKAWLTNGAAWLRLANSKENNGFWHIAAKNPGYKTYSVAVPTATLLNAVSETMTIKLP